MDFNNNNTKQQLYQINTQPDGFRSTEQVLDLRKSCPELIKYLNALKEFQNNYVFRCNFTRDFNNNFTCMNKEVKEYFNEIVYQMQLQLIRDGYLCAYRYDENEFYTNIENKHLNILKMLDPVDQWTVIETLFNTLKDNINNYMFANGLYLEEDSGVINNFNKSPTYHEFYGEIFITNSLIQSVNYINQVYEHNNEHLYTLLSLSDVEEALRFVPKAMNERAQLVISNYIKCKDADYTEFKHSTLKGLETIIFDQLQELVEIKEFKYNSIEDILKTDIGMLYTSLKYNECPQLEQSNLDPKTLNLSNISGEDIKRFKSLCAHVKRQFIAERILFYKPKQPVIPPYNPYNQYNPQYKNLDCTIKELLNLLEKDSREEGNRQEGNLWQENTSTGGWEEGNLWQEGTNTSSLADIASIWDTTENNRQEGTNTSGLADIASIWNTTDTDTNTTDTDTTENNNKTYTIKYYE